MTCNLKRIKNVLGAAKLTTEILHSIQSGHTICGSKIMRSISRIVNFLDRLMRGFHNALEHPFGDHSLAQHLWRMPQLIAQRACQIDDLLQLDGNMGR